jgi:uncharacterized membrane protein affecting hemolysin expression
MAEKKPFSRSAQKRQSVQMLGSIEHLQHHFVRQAYTHKRELMNQVQDRTDVEETVRVGDI